MVMLREKAQSVEHLGRNTNAPSRGGLVRSSNEVPVMGMERRDKRVREAEPQPRRRSLLWHR